MKPDIARKKVVETSRPATNARLRKSVGSITRLVGPPLVPREQPEDARPTGPSARTSRRASRLAALHEREDQCRGRGRDQEGAEQVEPLHAVGLRHLRQVAEGQAGRDDARPAG